MSLAAILAELQHLRRDVADLTSRVVALESAPSTVPESSFASPAGPLTVNYVSAGAESYLASPVPPLPSLASSSVIGPTSPSQIPVGVEISEAERHRIALQIGDFFKRSLSGQHRGPSGRRANPLASKIYVLCRDRAGVTYSPVRLFRSFSSLRPFIGEGQNFGESVFAGFPTSWEAKLAVERADLIWPADAFDV